MKGVGPDPYLVVQAAMTDAQQEAFLEKLKGTNMDGAHVADALAIFHDGDLFVRITDEVWEKLPHLQGNPYFAPSIIAMTFLRDGKRPDLHTVAHLCHNATTEAFDATREIQ
jgi:hypothetical protein